jgi:hypothetical protein
MWSRNRLRWIGHTGGFGADTRAEPITLARANAHTSAVADAIAEPNAGTSGRAVTDSCTAGRGRLPDDIGTHAAGGPWQDLHDAECRCRRGAER